MPVVRTECMLIDGAWRAASDGAVIEVHNPVSRHVVATVPRASQEDLEAALDAAERVYPSWSKSSHWERSRMLRAGARLIEERADDIAQLLTLEQGKPIAQARAEVASSVEQFDWYADEARRVYGRTVPATTAGLRVEVRREAIGPVAAFTPWNFPVMLAARKLAPALAAGCPIIIKPAEEAPSACLAMIRALHDAGFPSGAIGTVTGDPSYISKTLLASPVIRKLSLTGSVPVGQHLMRLAADNLTVVSLELGGHAPVVVCDDVDIAAVARACVQAKYRNAGQVCVSPTRFLVPADQLDDFSLAFVEATEQLKVGDGMDPLTDVGPMCNARRHDDFAASVEAAVRSGATVVSGGHSRSEQLGGYFYAPTVLQDIPSDARILQEEPFGPVALLLPYEDLNEAVSQANSTQYGLAAYAFTDDLHRAQFLSENLDAGMVGLNTFAISTVVAPFSGVRMSGIGAENGTEGIEMYLHPKTVITGISKVL